MNFTWHVFVNLGFLSFALLISTLLRVRFKFFQKYLIPNALTAGFIALPFYNFVFPALGLTSIQLGELTYHFLGISFVALGLRPTPPRKEGEASEIYPTVIGVLSQIILQAFIGFVITLILIYTFMPDLFHTFGFLLPLGFAEGPGQAYSIGEAWKEYGVMGAGDVGLTFGALGFVLCCFGGIFLINHGLRKGWVSQQELVHMKQDGIRTGIRPKNKQQEAAAYQVTDSEAIDTFSLHIALVLGGYFLAWVILKIITLLLGLAGPIGMELAANLWGLHFIWSVSMGLLLKFIMTKLGFYYVVDSRTITRISGVSVDIMVTSAIAAISITIVSQYWLPILIIAGTGALVTFYGTIWFCSRLFKNHRFLRTLFIFGVSSGTLSTGLALLRAIDPEFESPVAVDYTYASGIGFALMIPIILIINLPLQTFKTGNLMYCWITFGILGIYALFIFISYLLISKKRAFGRHKKLWFPISAKQQN